MNRALAAVAAIVLVSGCPRHVATTSATYGLEEVPADEAKDIAAAVAIGAGFMAKHYPEGVRPALRDAHPKAHGCVKARFTVADSLDAPYRKGVFAEARSYDAWIRFSNSNRFPQGDSVGDARGMGIKLMGVPGDKILEDAKDAQTQDFVMINNPVFFVRNVHDYIPFSNKLNQGLAVLAGWLTAHPHEAGIILAINNKTLYNPLLEQYSSMSPYLMGQSAMKFTAKPCSTEGLTTWAREGDDYLAANMARNLQETPGCFDFMVQLRTDPDNEPIEDPTIEWKGSEYRTVARIDIPLQEFQSPEQQEFCENLSFNPWHSLPEHQPLGGINRMRKAVYEAISKARHGDNGAPRTEPVAGDDFLPAGD